jgi:hypothetical protein
MKNPIKYLCGFILGIMFTLTFASEQTIEEIDSKSNKIIKFGDVKMLVTDANTAKEFDGTIEEILIIFTDDYPFISLMKDFSGKLNSISIFNGKNQPIVKSEFKEGRILNFGIYGNKVHDNRKMPVFFFEASDKPNVWHKIKYIPMVKGIVENGKLVDYAPKGEMYEDLDFDGQFDVKSMRNEDKKVLSQHIYIDGTWLEVYKLDSEDKLRTVGYFDAAILEAMIFDGERKIYYDFEFGKGWKKRSVDSAK